MTEYEFMDKCGYVPLAVTTDYPMSALSISYNVEDSLIEFIDNAYDARGENFDYKLGDKLIVNFNYDEDKKTLSVEDNGVGISNMENLFKIGGTNKSMSDNTIGKYGSGVIGATANIASACRCNKDENVHVRIETAHNGGYGFVDIIYTPSGSMVQGKPKKCKCDDCTQHYTRITFENVCIEGHNQDIYDKMSETFEETFKRGLVVTYNGRNIGENIEGSVTFNGEEHEEPFDIKGMHIIVKHRTIANEMHDKKASDRAYRKAGLRVYDSTSGRRLSMDTDDWRLFCGKSAQQNICGIRVGIFIPSTKDAYQEFGIVKEKNGRSRKAICKDEAYEKLSKYLKKVYMEAATHAIKKDLEENPTKKLNGVYYENDPRPSKKKQLLSFLGENNGVLHYSVNTKPAFDSVVEFGNQLREKDLQIEKLHNDLREARKQLREAKKQLRNK